MSVEKKIAVVSIDPLARSGVVRCQATEKGSPDCLFDNPTDRLRLVPGHGCWYGSPGRQVCNAAFADPNLAPDLFDSDLIP